MCLSLYFREPFIEGSSVQLIYRVANRWQGIWFWAVLNGLVYFHANVFQKIILLFTKEFTYAVISIPRIILYNELYKLTSVSS